MLLRHGECAETRGAMSRAGRAAEAPAPATRTTAPSHTEHVPQTHCWQISGDVPSTLHRRMNIANLLRS